MAKREVYDCDRCSATNLPESVRRFIVTGRSLDAAGSMDDEGDHVDLCYPCQARALGIVLNQRDYKLNKMILDWAKGKGPKGP